MVVICMIVTVPMRYKVEFAGRRGDWIILLLWQREEEVLYL